MMELFAKRVICSVMFDRIVNTGTNILLETLADNSFSYAISTILSPFFQLDLHSLFLGPLCLSSGNKV